MSNEDLRDVRAELDELAQRIADHQPSVRPIGPATGDWVLLVCLPSNSTGVYPVPVLESKRRMWLARYATKREALEDNRAHRLLQRHGGWLLNVRTGETKRVELGTSKPLDT